MEEQSLVDVVEVPNPAQLFDTLKQQALEAMTTAAGPNTENLRRRLQNATSPEALIRILDTARVVYPKTVSELASHVLKLCLTTQTRNDKAAKTAELKAVQTQLKAIDVTGIGEKAIKTPNARQAPVLMNAELAKEKALYAKQTALRNEIAIIEAQEARLTDIQDKVFEGDSVINAILMEQGYTFPAYNARHQALKKPEVLAALARLRQADDADTVRIDSWIADCRYNAGRKFQMEYRAYCDANGGDDDLDNLLTALEAQDEIAIKKIQLTFERYFEHPVMTLSWLYRKFSRPVSFKSLGILNVPLQIIWSALMLPVTLGNWLYLSVGVIQPVSFKSLGILNVPLQIIWGALRLLSALVTWVVSLPVRVVTWLYRKFTGQPNDAPGIGPNTIDEDLNTIDENLYTLLDFIDRNSNHGSLLADENIEGRLKTNPLIRELAEKFGYFAEVRGESKYDARTRLDNLRKGLKKTIFPLSERTYVEGNPERNRYEIDKRLKQPFNGLSRDYGFGEYIQKRELSKEPMGGHNPQVSGSTQYHVVGHETNTEQKNNTRWWKGLYVIMAITAAILVAFGQLGIVFIEASAVPFIAPIVGLAAAMAISCYIANKLLFQKYIGDVAGKAAKKGGGPLAWIYSLTEGLDKYWIEDIPALFQIPFAVAWVGMLASAGFSVFAALASACIAFFDLAKMLAGITIVVSAISLSLAGIAFPVAAVVATATILALYALFIVGMRDNIRDNLFRKLKYGFYTNFWYRGWGKMNWLQKLRTAFVLTFQSVVCAAFIIACAVTAYTITMGMTAATIALEVGGAHIFAWLGFPIAYQGFVGSNLIINFTLYAADGVGLGFRLGGFIAEAILAIPSYPGMAFRATIAGIEHLVHAVDLVWESPHRAWYFIENIFSHPRQTIVPVWLGLKAFLLKVVVALTGSGNAALSFNNPGVVSQYAGSTLGPEIAGSTAATASVSLNYSGVETVTGFDTLASEALVPEKNGCSDLAGPVATPPEVQQKAHNNGWRDRDDNINNHRSAADKFTASIPAASSTASL